MMNISNELLLNATLVSDEINNDYFEFVVDDNLKANSCVRVCFIEEQNSLFVKNEANQVTNNLYELNHVRVNPNQDNRYIISCLTKALNSIGVEVVNAPEQDSIAMLYRPMGEVSDNVRFYVDENLKLHFLSVAARKTLTCITNTKYKSRPISG